MKCEACNGTGDGLKTGDRKCSECNGTGCKCDICGESCPVGADICEQCDEKESK